MNFLNLACLSLIVVVLAGLKVNQVVAIECYECKGNLTTEVGKACAKANSGTATPGYTSCYVIATPGTDKLPPWVERGGQTLPLKTECTRNECYCSTNKCNGYDVKVPYLSCYSCSTLSMMSSDCGEGTEWSQGSDYVTKVDGCHACTKTKGFDGSVVRGCSYSAQSTNRCDVNADGTTCYCTGSLCNSAQRLPITRLHVLMSALTIFSLLKWLHN
jgi:hypothetical protein